MSAMTIVRLAALGLGLCLASLNSAEALTSKECSVKYQAAKSAGTLNGSTWRDFQKTQCSGPAAEPAAATAPAPAPAPAAAPAPIPAAPAAAPASNPLKPATPAPATAAKTAPPAPAAASNAVFPSAVNPKYSTLSAGKARMQTCLDQYNSNKASNGNGTLKWIQTGGGYYSECNKRLKGV